jgi:hypothetical protein
VEYEDINESWREPLTFPNSVIQKDLHSLRIDKDKRLFRYAPPLTESGELPPLEEWQQHLQHAWQQIQASYQDTFQPQAFIGMALLILDESVATHQVQCHYPAGTVTFKPTTDKIPNEKILLTVTSEELHDTLPATLEEFEPEFQPTTDWDNWQLQFSSQTFHLTPMKIGEQYPNPVFTVYGLAHGILPDKAAEQLQSFLCSGKVALMWQVLSRLIMQKWQFKRLDMAAYEFRKRLDVENGRYQQIPNMLLECASNKKLELNLLDMSKIEAEAKQMLARLDAGTRTLEINRYNLERHLHRSEQVWQCLNETTAEKYHWKLAWQNDTETPLLDSFDLNIRQLQNHTTYLQDALAYLEGIRARWQLHLDGRRLQYEFNIQIMLLMLTFIASFTGVVAFITQNPEQVAFLLKGLSNNPQQITKIGHLLLIGINLLILIFFVLPFCYFYMKFLWKKLRCWWKQWLSR